MGEPLTLTELEVELRAGLEGVTEGPWQKMRTPDNGDEEMYVIMAQPSPMLRGFTMPIAWAGEPLVSHLIRCNPDNILALLETIASLRSEVERLTGELSEWRDACNENAGAWEYGKGRATTALSSLSASQAREAVLREALDRIRLAATVSSLSKLGLESALAAIRGLALATLKAVEAGS